MKIIMLTADERARIADLADQTVGNDAASPEEIAEQAATAAMELPVRLRRHLAAARVADNDLTLVCGLPVADDLPPTPSSWGEAETTGVGWREESVLLICASALADPFGWASQQHGRLVHDICPVRGMEDFDTSACSTAALNLHTEDAFHRDRGDYVGLYCLRNPDKTSTTFVRASELRLSAGTELTLREERFHFRPDHSHQLVDGPSSSSGQAIIFGPAENPYLRYDTDFASAKDGDAVGAQATKVLDEKLASLVEHVVLEPGNALFIDNYQILHGRQPFRPRYDGTDRWLKRVNLTRDIRRLYVDGGRRRRIIGSQDRLGSS